MDHHPGKFPNTPVDVIKNSKSVDLVYLITRAGNWDDIHSKGCGDIAYRLVEHVLGWNSNIFPMDSIVVSYDSGPKHNAYIFYMPEIVRDWLVKNMNAKDIGTFQFQTQNGNT